MDRVEQHRRGHQRIRRPIRQRGLGKDHPDRYRGPMRFQSKVELGGKTATGIGVPDEVVAALDAGRRPAVRVNVGGHSYRTTVAPMGGRFFVPLSADNLQRPASRPETPLRWTSPWTRQSVRLMYPMTSPRR